MKHSGSRLIEKFHLSKLWLIVFGAVLAANPLLADEDFSLLSKRFLTNFQCARLSSDQAAMEKHFMAGLEQGKKFYDAARNNKVSEEQSKIPML